MESRTLRRPHGGLSEVTGTSVELLMGKGAMAYVRKKIKKGRPYYYVVESRREGPEMRTHQHILYYIGPEDKLMKLALEGWLARQSREGNTDESDTGSKT